MTPTAETASAANSAGSVEEVGATLGPVEAVSAADSGDITFEECETIYGELWNLGEPFADPKITAGMSDRCKVAREDIVLRRLRR